MVELVVVPVMFREVIGSRFNGRTGDVIYIYIYIIYILLKLKIIIENKNNKVYRNFDRVFSQIFLPIEVTIYLHIANTI